MIKAELRKEIAKALDLPEEKIHLEHPEDLKNGDFSTNVAFVMAKEAGKSPREIAADFARTLASKKIKNLTKVEAATNGFLNFYLDEKFFAESLHNILKNKKSFGVSEINTGKNVIVEYTDPNPFKEFHIGHLMTNTIGESLARLYLATGATTKKVCYQGDVGMHVAQAVYGLKKKGITEPTVKDMGEAYASGNKAYRESEEEKKEIENINKKIYDHSDEEINNIYNKGRSLSLSYFETIYQKLGTKFDHYFFESETAIFGKRMVVEGMLHNIFKESQGAVIYEGEKHGLHTRVFINKFGLPTYEAKDLGLAKLKYDVFPYDLSISVTANEIVDYFKVVKAALSELEPALSEKLKHISHGMMRLPSGKMSSRTGDVITAMSLIDEVKSEVLKKIGEREIENRDEVAEMVAIAAIKFSILKQAPGRDIIFDFDKSISFEGDSGPYLQYSAVRARSVLSKVSEKKEKKQSKKILGEISEVTEVERLLYRLPEITARACIESAPQYLVTYLLELAASFNSFYSNNQIIGSEHESHYLALTEAVFVALENGLNVLGIKVPHAM